mgnify:CR=1 FL=1
MNNLNDIFFAPVANQDLTYDQVLARADFSLTRPESGVQQGNPLGELVADAFLWAARELAAEDPGVPTVAVTADGVLRADLPAGDITVSQAFDVLSMGGGGWNLWFSTGDLLPHREGAAGGGRVGRLGDPYHAGGPAVHVGDGVHLQPPPDVFQPGDLLLAGGALLRHRPVGA